MLGRQWEGFGNSGHHTQLEDWIWGVLLWSSSCFHSCYSFVVQCLMRSYMRLVFNQIMFVTDISSCGNIVFVYFVFNINIWYQNWWILRVAFTRQKRKIWGNRFFLYISTYWGQNNPNRNLIFSYDNSFWYSSMALYYLPSEN